MNRRKWLQNAAAAGGCGALGLGIWGHRVFAADQFAGKLFAAAQADLTGKAHSEFQTLPAKARDEIREWFHGKCLNVAPFADQICSHPFREKPRACPSDDEQHQLLLVAFCGKVATDAEILTRVQTIAQETGQELDRNWGDCCKAIASKWNVHIREYAAPLDANNFLGRVDQLVREHLTAAIAQAHVSAQSPALGETFGKIGEAALMLLPMSQIRVNQALGQVDVNPGALSFGIPTFLLLALKHLFQYIMSLFSDPRPDIQKAVSAQVALLGNRVGSEFESEIRTRIGTLHDWQDQSLTRAARQYANEVVPWI